MKYLIQLGFILIIVFSCKDNRCLKNADNLRDKALNSYKEKDYASTIEIAMKASGKYEACSDTSGHIESLYILAKASAFSGNFLKAKIYGEKGSSLCKKISNDSLEFQINNIIGWAHSTLGTDYKENLSLQKRQLYLVEQLNDNENRAMIYNNYSYDVTVWGSLHIDKAIEYAKFANDYYAKVEKNNGRWYTLMNLTWQYRLKNELIKSEGFGRLAREQAIADNDRHAIIEANTNLGETLLQQNKIIEAAPLYQEALQQSSEEEDRDKYVFDVYHSAFLWKQGKQNEAISTLKKAITFLETNEVFYEMLARAFLAEYSYTIGDYREAMNQVSIFKKPRGNYFSIESRAIATIVEAKLLIKEGTADPIKLLEEMHSELDLFGAILLQNKISEAKKNLDNS